MALPVQLAELASSQLGMFTTEQSAAFVTGSASLHLHRSGQIRSMHNQVWLTAGSPIRRETELLAAILAAPEGACISHTTALQVLGILGPAKLGDSVHVTVSHTQAARRAGISVHRSDVPEEHRTVVAGLPVTTAARAFVDAAPFLRLAVLARALDAAIVWSDLRPEHVFDVLHECGRRRGTTKLRVLLDERLGLGDPTTIQSHLEGRLMRVVRRLDLPQPQRQYEMVVGSRTYRLDAYWPEYRLIVEMDGFGAHGKTKKQFDDDRGRDNDLVSTGNTVLRFTARMKDAEIERLLTTVIRRVV